MIMIFRNLCTQKFLQNEISKLVKSERLKTCIWCFLETISKLYVYFLSASFHVLCINIHKRQKCRELNITIQWFIKAKSCCLQYVNFMIRKSSRSVTPWKHYLYGHPYNIRIHKDTVEFTPDFFFAQSVTVSWCVRFLTACYQLQQN